MTRAAEIVEDNTIILNIASAHSFTWVDQCYIYLGNTNTLQVA